MGAGIAGGSLAGECAVHRQASCRARLAGRASPRHLRASASLAGARAIACRTCTPAGNIARCLHRRLSSSHQRPANAAFWCMRRGGTQENGAPTARLADLQRFSAQFLYTIHLARCVHGYLGHPSQELRMHHRPLVCSCCPVSVLLFPFTCAHPGRGHPGSGA